MSTFMANKGNIVRKWYILDAAGKPLGKTAATIFPPNDKIGSVFGISDRFQPLSPS